MSGPETKAGATSKQSGGALSTRRRATAVVDDRDVIVAQPMIVDDEMRRAIDCARARWGERGMVAEERVVGVDGRAHVMRFVGRQHDDFSWTALGVGTSWREAFANADGDGGRSS